jgi:uncharacterized membrane protein YphA (DoxX/SURF4 family)
VSIQIETTEPAATLSGADAVALALRVFALFLGIFFLAQSLNKLAWPGNPQLLLGRFQRWAPTARPEVQWYLVHVATPLAPLLARIIPVAEFLTAMAFILGFWIPATAMLALFMVLNFHFGTAAFYAWDFLRDGTGPPVIGGLIGLAIGGRNLPFTIQRLLSARRS